MTVVKKKTPTTSHPTSPFDNHLRRHRRRRRRLHLISAVTSSTHTFLHWKHNHDHLNLSQTHSLSSFLTSLSSHLLPLPISHSSFSLLLSLLTPSLSTSLPSSIPPSSALSSALLRLSSHDFPSSPRSFFLVLKAIVEKFGGLLISGASKEKAIVGFGWKSLPNCCGVLGFGKFRKRDGGYVLVQALVDSESRFMDLSAGWDGGLKGSVILGKTGFFRDVEEGRKFLCGHKYELGDGFGLNQYVLGEDCFPLLPWLLTPYGRTITRCNEDDEVEDMESFGLKEREFNRIHAREMGSVRKAFSRVRSRWRLLSVPLDEDWAECFPVVVFAACLLNNFLMECGDSEGDGYVEEEDEVAAGEDQPDEEELPAYEGAVDECGVMVRNALAEHLVKDYAHNDSKGGDGCQYQESKPEAVWTQASGG